MLGYYWTIEWKDDDMRGPVLYESRSILDCMREFVKEEIDQDLTMFCLKFGHLNEQGDMYIIEYAQLKPEWFDDDPRRALMLS